ncbi:hypothetical protein [Sorangium atrum]|uniref:Secreted protein n=1 Tax=Sorangium atrum TaxID=2995308 RepID=A0ABT5BRV2_9BACT|nr:hypothetical protein [Sorangium aterium]MDC0676888.1 hypothetical protein [Sorangium aterium]
MLTQARGHTGVALLFFILAAALVGDRLAATPQAQGGSTPPSARYDLAQIDPQGRANGGPRAAGALAAAQATRSIAPSTPSCLEQCAQQ